MTYFNTFLILGLIFLCCLGPGGDYYWNQWASFMSVFSLVFAYQIYRKYHPSLGIYAGYLMFSATYVFMWRNNGYDTMGLSDLILERTALMNQYTFLMLSTPFLFYKDKFFYILKYSLIGCLFVYSHHLLFFKDQIATNGFLFSFSMSAAFVAGIFPFWVKFISETVHSRYLRAALYLYPVLAVIKTQTEVGIFMIAAILGVYLFKIRKLYLAAYTTVLLSSVYILHYFQWITVLDSRGRTKIWKLAFTYWADHVSALVGSGTGSLYFLLPKIQHVLDKENKLIQKDHWYVFLHSDWLTVLFENGVIGLILALIAAYYLIKNAWGRTHYLAAICAYFIFMAVNFPIHLAPTALLGMFIIHGIYKDKEEKEVQC